MTAHRSHPPMRPEPPPRPTRHSASRYAALLRPIAAATLVGSLLVVTSTVAHTQTDEPETDDTPTEQTETDDTPTEDTETDDTPTETEQTETDEPETEQTGTDETETDDAQTEDTETDDTPTEDTETDDTPTEDTGTDDTPTDETGEQVTDDVRDEVRGRGWGPYGCPQRPPSLYHPEESSWSDWCLDPDYWIVEVTCGPEHSHAGRTFRFSAEPERGAQPSLADICGAVECPPVTSGAAADGGAAPDGTRLAGSLVTTGPGGETFLTTGVDGALVTTGPGGDTFVTTGTEGAEVTIGPEGAATGGGATPAGEPPITAVAGEPCGAPWPEGSWFRYAATDPITGDAESVLRLSGAWRGARHRSTAVTPALVIRCAAGVVSVVVRVGGVFAPDGRGVAVQYRAGEVLRAETWQDVPSPEARLAGVSPPRWLVDDLLAVLRQNPGAELLVRVFALDGAPMGTAAFDLAGIESLTEPTPGLCGL